MNTRDSIAEAKKDWKSRLPDADHNSMLCLLALDRVAAIAERNRDKILGQLDIHPTGFELLVMLYRMNQPYGIPLAQLADKLNVTAASVTNRVDHLVKKGWLDRVQSDVDRRVTYARLTKDGTKVVEKLLEKYVAAQCAQLDGLKKSERKDLLKLLVKVADHLEGVDAEDDED